MVHMDITPYVELLRRDLQNAADVGETSSRAVAERLLIALDPSARLALMEALLQAAAEITAEMRQGSVDVRLQGRELTFVVEGPSDLAAPPAPPAPPTEEEDTSLARVTLRLPEAVKKRAEEIAGASGQSLNTWLVNAVRVATAGGDAAQSGGFGNDIFGADLFGGSHRGKRRVTGWL